ncbi:MAG TPA: efflux RND transporter permease subunit [Pseudomonadales bacterium]|nr:efflux RND transporter permease subunit [Pseudomonadales bacterium]
MAGFFIDRPVFAWVLAIIVMLAGSLALTQLPVAVYPKLAPPSVGITATYPGASAKTLEDTVTQVIEQQMNGLDHLDYMSANSTGSGMATVTLTFTSGTNADIAQVQVQNKLQAAMPLLPPEVQQQGLKVAKASKSFLMVMTVSSKDGSMNTVDVGNFIASNIQDPVARVNGVGIVQLLGTQYAMRIWMQPEKLQAFNLTPLDLTTAIRAQNVQVAAGQLGGMPNVKDQRLNATIMAQSRLQTPEQFGDILLRVNADGSQVRLKDVARIERGGESYNFIGTYNNTPAAALAITQAPGANALETAEAVKQKIRELQPYFPPGIQVNYPYDLTPFVKISIEEVVKTLFEAIALVFLVMFLFLQNWRATLIPTIAVPVVLLGTFAVMAVAGFSINILTMFGLVLAMGLLVDDAIVVVENVERIMREERLPPLAATHKAMQQITGALVGVGLVLVAVFVPMSFLSGSSGAIYRQFTLTMVAAMVLSVLVAMILTPALCATILKPFSEAEYEHRNGFFGWFNRTFDKLSVGYRNTVGRLIPNPRKVFAVYALILAGVVYLFTSLPTSFLPDEDQGFFANVVILPVGSTSEQSLAVMDKIRDHYLNDEKDVVKEVFYVVGFSWAGSGQNVAQMFVALKPWSERKGPGQSVQAIIGRAMAFYGTIREAQAIAINPSPVQELGNSTGFDLQLQDRAGLGHEALMAARNQLLGLAKDKADVVTRVRPNGLDDTPMYQLDINQEKASALGLNLADVYSTMTTAFGSTYVNDFIDRGRVKRVYLMGDAPSRMQPEDLGKWHVRNNVGAMVPFSAFATAHWIYGSPKLERHNGVPSVQIQGNAAPGKSTGDAMRTMEELVSQLPPGFGFEWTGMSHEEKQAGQQAPLLYVVSVLVVFLCLAALYESWSIPFSVILVVPLGVLGALFAAKIFGLSNDVYFQVGLLTTVGLAAKNAILIVEFAKAQHERGLSLVEAAMAAVRLRLRPIIMTSLAFLLGVLPLALSSGAGAASRNAIGIGVSGGLLAATFLVIFFVPVFFVAVVGRLGKGAGGI